MARPLPVPSRVVDATISLSLQRAERFIARGRGVLAVLMLIRFLAVGLYHPNGWHRASVDLPATLVAIAGSVWLAGRARRGTISPRVALFSVALDSVYAVASLATNVLWPWPSYPGLLRLPDIGALLLVVILAGLRPIVSSALLGACMGAGALLALAGLDAVLNAGQIDYDWSDVWMMMLYIVAVGAMSVFSVYRIRRLSLMAARKSASVVWARRGLSTILQDHHDVGSILMSAVLNLEGSLRLLGRLDRRDEELRPVLGFLRADLMELVQLVRTSRERAFTELSHASGRRSAQVRHAVQNAIARTQQRFADRHLTCVLAADLDVLLLGGRPSLERLLCNLLVNACEGDGTRHATCVNVRVDAVRGRGVISIEDDGPGIDPATIDRQQGSASTKLGGSGLGLFLCRRTVSASGGRFSIRSGVGGGCVVRIELPLDDGLPPDSTEFCPESSQFVAVSSSLGPLGRNVRVRRWLLDLDGDCPDPVTATDQPKQKPIRAKDQGPVTLCGWRADAAGGARTVPRVR